MSDSHIAAPSERWAALKARGNPTLREIDEIDNATPWSPKEPDWWCEMMDVRQAIVRNIPPTDLPARIRDVLAHGGTLSDSTALAAVDEIDRLRAEVADLRVSVIAFGGPWAVQYAQDFGLPAGYLHAQHYDILARAGARMDDFIRSEGAV